MTPPKSLMALGAAIVLAAPSVARADDAAGEWLALKTKPTYFVHNVKPDSDNFAKMQKQSFVGPLPLWVSEKKKDGTFVKVESEATLNCRFTQKKAWTCWVRVNDKTHGRYDIAGVEIGAKVTPPQAPPPVDQKPEGVSPEVWTAVVRSGKVKQAHWAQAARDVEQALQSPKGAKMRAAGNAGMEQLLAGVEADIEAKADDAKIVKDAIDLSEKIAVPNAPADVPPPDVKGKPVGQVGPDGKPVGEVDGANVLNILAKELAKPEVQGDMAKRLVAFLTKPDNGAVYIDAKGHEDAAAAQLEKGVTEGVAKLTSTQEGRGRAAVLYFMLGEPQALPWFKDFAELESMVREQQMRGFFKDAMKRWTVAGAGTPGVADAGPYRGDAGWPAQFITDALDKADATWRDPRVKGKIKQSVEENAQPVTAPSEVGKGRELPGGDDLRNLMARSFDANDMYRNGAYVRDVLIPGSKPPKYRTISIKVYSQQTKWGPPPVVEDRLGIYDITEVSPDGGRTPSRIFGQFFPLNQRGESSFLLDDRDSKSIKYKLKMDGGNISFVPTEKDGKTPVGEPMSIAVRDLYDKRNEELGNKDQSYMATLNGQSFRVIPQGGPRGMLVYFAADATGHAIGDSPVLTTDLSQVSDKTGKTEVMRDERPLGYIGKDEKGDPQFWSLFWNDALQAYEARASKAPKDPPFDPMNPPKDDKDKGKDKGKGDAKKPAGGDGSTPTAGNGDDNTDNNADNTDDNTDTPDPKDKGGSIYACDYKSKFTPQPKFELYRVHDKKWRLYTDGTVANSENNQSYLCLYGQFGLWFEGLVPKKTADDKETISLIGGANDGYLDLLVVKAAPAPESSADKGTVLIEPKEANNLIVNGEEKLLFGKDSQRNLASNVEYFIPLKGLKASIKQSNGIAAVAHVAWLELSRDFLQGNQNPLLKVYIRPGDDAKAVITKAVVDYGGENTVCKSGDKPSKELASYIDSVAKDPDLKKELDKADMKNANTAMPSVMISCLAQSTGQDGKWKVAWTSWSLSKKVLYATGGNIDAGTGYAEK